MTQNNTPSSGRVPGVKSLFAYWIIFGFVGFFLPILVYSIIHSDYLVHWHVVAQAPPHTANLMVGDVGELLVRTSSGQLLSCNTGSPGCRELDVIPTHSITELCDLHSAPFNSFAHPPKNFINCVYSKGGFAEVGFTVLYALDQQGNIWKWENSSLSSEEILIPIVALLGGFTGFSAGSVIWVVRRIIYQRRVERSLAAEGGALKTKWVWLLAGLPLLCMLCFGTLLLARLTIH